MATKQEIATQGTQTPAMTGQVNDKFITGLIQQVKQKQELGLSFPADYNPVNELNAAYLVLKQTKDRNNKPALEVCNPASVATALMQMVNSHLSMMKSQCYPIVYGNQLNIQPSVFGNTCNARRYGMVDINATCIYEGDNFKFHIEDGKTVIDSHTQDFENIDITKIKGVYAVATFRDGTKKAEIMNMAQLKSAWAQGYGYKENGNGTHQKFTDQMAKKTVKNRLLKEVIRTHGEPDVAEAYEKYEEQEAIDTVAEDVAYDIETHANKEEFVIDEPPAIEEKPEPKTVADVTAGVKEKEAVKVEKKEQRQDIPAFMRQEVM